MTQLHQPLQPARPRLGLAVGGFLLVAVALVYVMSWRAGRWPPSHPWSGITLVALAVGQLVNRSPDRSRLLTVLRIASAILAIVGACLWLASSLTHASS
jgi:hypothetical protein